jgi:hypothetical protein
VINVPPRKLGAASLAGLDAWAASRGQPLGAAIFQGCQVLAPRSASIVCGAGRESTLMWHTTGLASWPFVYWLAEGHWLQEHPLRQLSKPPAAPPQLLLPSAQRACVVQREKHLLGTMFKADCTCALQDWDPEDGDLPPLPTHREMGISSTAHRALRAFRHLICDARAFGRSAPLTDTLWHLLRKARRNADSASPPLVPCSTQ